jgi:hypothetical protein
MFNFQRWMKVFSWVVLGSMMHGADPSGTPVVTTATPVVKSGEDSHSSSEIFLDCGRAAASPSRKASLGMQWKRENGVLVCRWTAKA